MEIFVLKPSDCTSQLLDPIEERCGTVVLWEKLDRILQYRDPFGTWEHKRMLELARDIDDHLAMVFHPFLADEIDREKLSITVNGSQVEPWDPFCRDEPNTSIVSDVAIPVSAGANSGMTRVASFVLPHQNDFSSKTAWNRASGHYDGIGSRACTSIVHID